MSRLGMGVMIQALCGNEETIESLKKVIGKTIQSLSIEDENLVIGFEGGVNLNIWDGGQSCCEYRYMKCDDNLSDFIGAEFHDVQIKDYSESEGDYEVHEIQFVDINTSKGTFQIVNHNQHNGYYGGFWLQANISYVN